MRSICRPTINQRSFFNGHKRTHAIKFQSVVVPDGLVMHLSGPYPGLMHDAAMLRFSGLLVDMETSLVDDDETDFILYGDAGYPITSQLLVPYKEIHPTEEQVVIRAGFGQFCIHRLQEKHSALLTEAWASLCCCNASKQLQNLSAWDLCSGTEVCIASSYNWGISVLVYLSRALC